MTRIMMAALACVLIFIFSCKKESSPQETDPVKPVGVATEVGVPDGSPVSKKTIDANGGSLTSNDGRIKITIPAGALSTAQEISIQPISNKNPLGIQEAYRLEPHGVQFSKAVTIEFSYNDDQVKNSIPEALGIAYQDEKGIWQAQGGTVLDKASKKIKVTTNHFSDWSVFESFYLIASGTVVPVNGTIQLEVFTTEDLLVPLTAGEEVPMGKKVSMAASRVKEWKLAGAGNLQSSGANATYKAPPNVPGAPNPVAVSVKIDLKQRGTFLLVRHIEVAEDDGEIEVRVAGNGWVKKTASPVVRAPDGTYMIGDSDGDTQGSYVLIMWQGGLGTHTYKSPYVNIGTHVHYLVTGIDNYTCSYISGADELVASGGGVTITSMGEDDGFIKGTFVISPAGHGPGLKSTIEVEGKFRVRKTW